jgi:hypothetical protein
MGQLHLIEIDSDLVELFSNDKQIDDALRQFLKQQGTEKQKSAPGETSKDIDPGANNS